MNSLKKSKVLVTGATSYLGIRLIEQLENKVGQIIGITQNVQKRVLFSEGFGKKVKLFKGSHGYKAGEQRRDFVHIDDCVSVLLWFFN